MSVATNRSGSAALPNGYREFSSSAGATADAVGGLPAGYRRVVAPNGNIELLAPDGRTFDPAAIPQINWSNIDNVVVDSYGNTVRVGETSGGPGTYLFSDKFPKKSADADYQVLATGAPRNVEYYVKTDVLPSGGKWFDGYDQATGHLLDGKRYENWPKDGFELSMTQVRKDIVDSAKIAAKQGLTVEFRVKSDYGVQKMTEILDNYNDLRVRQNLSLIENVVIRKYP